MSDSQDPLDRLTEEFFARIRAGERLSVDEFARQHPEFESELRELLPGLTALEELSPEQRDADLPPAHLGEYRILREIGRGGMGVVYEAEQVNLGRRVALKVLPFHRLLDKERLERFKLEAQAAARLHHPNIVPVYGVGEDDGTHFFAMQYVAGQGVDDVIDELKQLRDEGKSTASVRLTREPSTDSARDYFRNVARIGIAVADALEHAHSHGVLHRDIKPSNLLLDRDGEVWITDFGLAKADENEGLTRTGDIVGTVGYMAPERFEGRSDQRSDLYGLGLVLYELATLRRAFADSDLNRLVRMVTHEEPVEPRKIDPHVPRDLETIVLKSIAKEPRERYDTTADLMRDLESFVAGKPIRARPISAWERSRKWVRRRPTAAALVLVSALALVVVAGGSIWWASRPGVLHIEAFPGGEIFVDGRKVGDDAAVGLEVAPGAHEIVVTNEGFKEFRATVDLGAGDSKPFNPRLEAEDPASAVTLRAWEKRLGIQLRAGPIESERGPTRFEGPALLIRPRGRVRVQDASVCAAELSAPADARLVLLDRDDKVMHEQRVMSDGTRLRHELPSDVVARLDVGHGYSWGLEIDGGGSFRTEFTVAAELPTGTLEDLRSRFPESNRELAALFEIALLQREGLDLAALLKAVELADSWPRPVVFRLAWGSMERLGIEDSAAAAALYRSYLAASRPH